MKNDGKYFERKSHAIISRLNPGKDVIPNVRIVGKLSETSRQLDVIQRDPGEYDFIAFECKDESGAIGTPTVEGYYTKLMDVGAKHGAIVSNTSYSRGARRTASKLKIDLLNLVDTDDDKIKTQLIAPTAVIHERVTQWGVGFSSQPPSRVMDGDLSKLKLGASDGQEKTLSALANDLWQEMANDPDVKEGVRDVGLDGLSAEVGGTRVPLPRVTIRFDIAFERRLGHQNITQSQGIFNVREGSYQTSHMAVGEFSEDIFKTWEPVSEEQMNTAKPFAIIRTRSDLSQSHPA
jgi:hypothetical protein